MDLKQAMFESVVKKRSAIYSEPLISMVIVLTAVMVLYAPSKLLAALFLLPIMAVLYIGTSRFTKIVFPIIMITFPITLQYSGKDAFSTGSIIIFITLAWTLITYRVTATLRNDKFLFSLLLLLISIAFIGMVTKTPELYWGPAIRHYLNFLSSIAVFFLITHSQHIRGMARNKHEYIEKIINVLLWITVIHIFISILLLNFPWIEKHFTIFFSRTQEHLSGYITDGAYTRATTIFVSGEGFGELIVLLFPFALYKIFVSKNKLYLFVAASLFFGMMLSGTRSAFMIIAFQIVLFVYVLAPRRYHNKKFVFTVAFGSICIVMLPAFWFYGPILMERIQDTMELIRKGEGIVAIFNRSAVWPQAYNVTRDTISLFGYGPIQANRLSLTAKNFHCLYLSMIFQFGIIGTVVFLIFFYTIMRRLLKGMKKIKYRGPDYLLIVTCLLSFSCFLINEIKFEFNRSDSYQQLVWIVFAVFYLTGQLWRNFPHEKTYHYQPGAIRVSY